MEHIFPFVSPHACFNRSRSSGVRSLARFQAASSGGRVHAILHKAINLPDKDKFQQSGLSDPYVRLEVGSTVAKSSVADGTLNPVRKTLCA